jgi:hypothetical protein
VAVPLYAVTEEVCETLYLLSQCRFLGVGACSYRWGVPEGMSVCACIGSCFGCALEVVSFCAGVRVSLACRLLYIVICEIYLCAGLMRLYGVLLRLCVSSAGRMIGRLRIGSWGGARV